MLPNDVGERRGESRGCFVAPLLREDGVATDVRDQEDLDLRGWLVRSCALFGVATAHLRRSIRGLTDPRIRPSIDPSVPGREGLALPCRLVTGSSQERGA